LDVLPPAYNSSELAGLVIYNVLSFSLNKNFLLKKIAQTNIDIKISQNLTDYGLLTPGIDKKNLNLVTTAVANVYI